MPVNRIPKPTVAASNAELERQYLSGEGWQTVEVSGSGPGGNWWETPATGPVEINMPDDGDPLTITIPEGAEGGSLVFESTGGGHGRLAFNLLDGLYVMKNVTSDPGVQINLDGTILSTPTQGEPSVYVDGWVSIGIGDFFTNPALTVRGSTGGDPSTSILICIDDSESGQTQFEVRRDGNVICPNLPTADPHLPGGLWNNAGTLNISSG